MNWIKANTEKLGRRVDKMNVIIKNQEYFPLPDHIAISYWEQYNSDEDIQEYDPQNAMDIMRNIQDYFEQTDHEILMLFIIEIMKAGMYLNEFQNEHNIEKKDENEELVIPDYRYVF